MEDIRESGVFVPERDATWERVRNAYFDLSQRPSQCDYHNCHCPHKKKNKYSAETGRWAIKFCYYCGGSGIHNFCNLFAEKYVCSACNDVRDVCREIEDMGQILENEEEILAAARTKIAQEDLEEEELLLPEAQFEFIDDEIKKTIEKITSDSVFPQIESHDITVENVSITIINPFNFCKGLFCVNKILHFVR